MEIHRCRFVPYPPSPINALAFSHTSSAQAQHKAPADLRLAVGRANGDIELWNPLQGTWVYETTFKGGKDRSIEGLAWVQDPDEADEHGRVIPGRLRLFSIGDSTYVTEWDLDHGRPLRHSSGNYGEIWCLAAQPRGPLVKKSAANGFEATSQEGQDQGQGQDLAVGCADGAIILLSTADNDLKFKRALSRPSAKKARVLSLTFQGRHMIIAGCADSTIRIIDAQAGRLVRNMSLGAGPSGGPREILVWAVRCLPDGTIVSGDSTGEVRFWDGRTHTILQRLKGHQADVLDLETSADGRTVISGGMDRRSTVYRKTGNAKGVSGARWATISHQRRHSHDVKAMSSFEASNMSVVASGGLDTNLIIIPLREVGKENHRTLSSLPHLPSLQSAPAKRLVMSWWDRQIWLWHIPEPSDALLDVYHASPEQRQQWKLVCRVNLKGDESVTSASLAASGELLAVSSMAQVKIFRLRSRMSGHIPSIQARRVEVPAVFANTGARHVQFSPDARWLCAVTPDNTILVANIDFSDHEPPTFLLSPRVHRLKRRATIIATGRKETHLRSLGGYESTITRVAFSSASTILVVGDLSGRLDSWVLARPAQALQDTVLNGDEDASSASDESTSDEEDEDAATISRVHDERWVRNPSTTQLNVPTAPLVLSFRPSGPSSIRTLANGHSTPNGHEAHHGEDRLLVITSRHQILEFEVLAGRLTAWSRQNKSASLPADFRGLRDRAMACFWDPKPGRERVWVYGTSWLCFFDVSQNLREPSRSGDAASHDGKGRKRKRSSGRLDDVGKGTSGAGSKIPEPRLSIGIGRRLRKLDGHAQTSVSLDGKQTPSSDEEDGVEGHSALQDLRRSAVNGHGAEDAGQDGGAHMVTRSSNPARKFWCTTKYRPILGMVLMRDADYDRGLMAGLGDEDSQGPEVVLVERPLWDVDLPPRFYGDQEWPGNKAAYE